MSAHVENNQSQSAVVEQVATEGIYASLFGKINLEPVAALSDLNSFQDDSGLAEVTANERVTAGVQVFLERLKK